jgi:hypothetical protein
VRPVEGVVNDEGTYDGAMVPPGRYAVRLTVDGHTESRPFTVVDDPRMGASPAELAAAYDYTRRTVAKVNEVADARATSPTSSAPRGPRRRREGAALRPAGDRRGAPGDRLARGGARGAGGRALAGRPDHAALPGEGLQPAAQREPHGAELRPRPTEQAHAVLRELGAQVDALVGRMRALERNEVEAFNRLVAGLPMPAVPVAAPAAVP